MVLSSDKKNAASLVQGLEENKKKGQTSIPVEELARRLSEKPTWQKYGLSLQHSWKSRQVTPDPSRPAQNQSMLRSRRLSEEDILDAEDEDEEEDDATGPFRWETEFETQSDLIKHKRAKAVTAETYPLLDCTSEAIETVEKAVELLQELALVRKMMHSPAGSFLCILAMLILAAVAYGLLYMFSLRGAQIRLKVMEPGALVIFFLDYAMIGFTKNAAKLLFKDQLANHPCVLGGKSVSVIRIRSLSWQHLCVVHPSFFRGLKASCTDTHTHAPTHTHTLSMPGIPLAMRIASIFIAWEGGYPAAWKCPREASIALTEIVESCLAIMVEAWRERGCASGGRIYLACLS